MTRETTAATMDEALERAAADAFGGVFVIAGHLTRLADAALEPWDLTTRQWLLLAVVGRGFPGRAPSLSEAAAAYGSSRQNVKQIAAGLEARGYLRLVRDELDGRTTRLVLTDRVLVFDRPEGRARARDLLATALEGFDRDEILTLAGLVGSWMARLARPVTESTASRKG